MKENVYECTRCGVSKPREDFPGKKKRNSWCKPCCKEQREEKKRKLDTTHRPVKISSSEEWDVADTYCQCGGGVYVTYSDLVCVKCGRVYRAPKSLWLGRRATEEEIDAARNR